jgi:hypothetical protein
MSFRRMQESMSFHCSDARGAVGGRVGAGSKQINVLRCHTYTKPYGYWLQRRSPTSRVSDGYGVLLRRRNDRAMPADCMYQGNVMSTARKRCEAGVTSRDRGRIGNDLPILQQLLLAAESNSALPLQEIA